MRYMNEYDLLLAHQRNAGHPVLAKATLFLMQFREEVNEHSDGWAYWRPPVQAAAKLMALVEGDVPATEQALTKAISPIKAFYTRRGYAAGMTFPAVEL